ncbi:hypothetical protein [Paenibacillus sp. UMB4589-SE434]|nr:hypothetical protein [Paenibacillus sp. UMB4589-SE434]
MIRSPIHRALTVLPLVLRMYGQIGLKTELLRVQIVTQSKCWSL